MELAEYLQHYQEFDREFFPQASVRDVEAKLLEEMEELEIALHGQDPAEKINELTDVMNLSIKLLKRYGIHQPLWFGAQKLEQTAEKYRQAGQAD